MMLEVLQPRNCTFVVGNNTRGMSRYLPMFVGCIPNHGFIPPKSAAVRACALWRRAGMRWQHVSQLVLRHLTSDSCASGEGGDTLVWGSYFCRYPELNLLSHPMKHRSSSMGQYGSFRKHVWKYMEVSINGGSPKCLFFWWKNLLEYIIIY